MRKNYVKNPSFEESVAAAWTNYVTSGLITRTRDTVIKRRGLAALKVSATIASDGGVEVNITLPAGTYSFGATCRTNAAVDNAHMVVRTLDDFTVLLQHNVAGASEWKRYGGTFTLVAEETIQVLLGLGSYGAASDGEAWFDEIAIIDEDALSEYFDGDTPATQSRSYEWVGVPHESESIERGIIVSSRQNIVENPSFEENITDFWSTFGTGTATKSRDTAQKKFGNASFKINANGINTDGGIEKVMTLPAGTYYLSGWIKTENITGDAKLVLRQNTDFAARINLTVNNTPSSKDWTRVSGTFTLEAERSMTLLMGLGPYGAPSQGIAWFDGILLEYEDDLVDYYDGDTADTDTVVYSWMEESHDGKSLRVTYEELQAEIRQANIPLIVGHEYRLVLNVRGTREQNVTVKMETSGGASQGLNQTYSIEANRWTTKRFDFTALSTNLNNYLRVFPQATNQNFYIDNVSLIDLTRERKEYRIMRIQGSVVPGSFIQTLTIREKTSQESS